jgi:hypothetical protein
MWKHRRHVALLRLVTSSGAYSPAFLAALNGGGAWRREARTLVARAAQRKIALKEETLIFSDVRDLQALQTLLHCH